MKLLQKVLAGISALAMVVAASPLFAGEENLVIPDFKQIPVGRTLLIVGIIICVLGALFGLFAFLRVKGIKVHQSMKDIGNLIFETCKTYLLQQGKFLIFLFLFIAVCIAFYFGGLQGWLVNNGQFSWEGLGKLAVVLGFSIVGILGSYGVAWFGVRMNTYANARTAFASLEGKPVKILNIPLQAGMSIGVLLVSVELIMMLLILLFIPGDLAGACFIGFAIGESLGASALRVAGGIFTKIADIGSDLMKIVFNIKEDDPRNPGVIADCTGDNAGDSVGPTADGFETYGVTGVALISFIVLALPKDAAANKLILLVWIFTMRFLMIITSVVSYWINGVMTKLFFSGKKEIDFERPLTNLIWVTTGLSIVMTFVVSYILLGTNTLGLANTLPQNAWLILSGIISCGTLAAMLIPEFTKIFTSPKSKHVKEVVNASKEGGASLTILSGLVSGNFSGFWIGILIVGLMFTAYILSTQGIGSIMTNPIFASVFAFGLVAFGFLGMGPVTIAVDSYGPVTDNAQSVYELSMIEEVPNIKEDIKKNFGFEPDFEVAKHNLEANDGAGNTFKATAKPVLIGTAVVGATTMIFSLILVIKNVVLKDMPNVGPEFILNLINPYTLLGFISGGAVIFWFTGASMQAVTTGAYSAVEYIKKHIHLDPNAEKKASTSASKEVVKICTQYAQKGMRNIFFAIFSFALAFAFFSAPSASNLAPVSFFVSYLIAIAVFGLFQAVFMANGGGAWDNAKKIVEVDLKQKGTPLHAATVIGDTVGDPFKDTSSVAMNPIIKFTTLFGLLAMEIAISKDFRVFAPYAGIALFLVALFFVWRSFYSMRIPEKK